MSAVTRPQRLAPTRLSTRLLTAFILAALVATGVAVTSPQPVLGATTIVTRCDGVNLRTRPSTSGSIKASLRDGTTVVSVAKVSGGSWRAVCDGRSVSGSSWFRISVVSGTSVSSRYGVSYVYAATALFKASSPSLTGSVPTVLSEVASAACDATARASASTTAAREATIRAGKSVTIVATVRGGSWSATCGGRSVSGTSWYRISAVDGRSVKWLYGVSYVYAASGLFQGGGTVPMAAACDGVSLRSSASTWGTLRGSLREGTVIGVNATLRGGGWNADCGRSVSGSSWYRISTIGGKSVSSLYGVRYVYAATGLFRAPSSGGAAPAAGKLTEGIDVSHWQGSIDWKKVAAAGKRFVYIKASESTNFVDSRYATNRVGAKGAGLYVGAYHFARPSGGSSDAVAEADHFLATAKIARGDLLPVLDLEVAGGLSTSALQSWTRSFLDRVYRKTGVRGVIYTSPTFWKSSMGNTTWFADNGYSVLWIAHWTTASEPSVPAGGWGGKDWTFWQYSDRGRVSGIDGAVDLNRYNGTDFSRVLVK